MNNYFIVVFQFISENFWFWFNEFKCRDESEFIERKKESRENTQVLVRVKFGNFFLEFIVYS